MLHTHTAVVDKVENDDEEKNDDDDKDDEDDKDDDNDKDDDENKDDDDDTSSSFSPAPAATLLPYSAQILGRGGKINRPRPKHTSHLD